MNHKHTKTSKLSPAYRPTASAVPQGDRYGIMRRERRIARSISAPGMIGMITMSIDGQVLDADAAMLRIFSYSKIEDMVGKHRSAFWKPADFDAPREDIDYWNHVLEGEPACFQRRYADQSGESIWLEVTAVPIFDKHGGVIKVACVARDVTGETARDVERDGQVEAIRKAMAVTEFALDGTILDANETFLSIFGYGLDDVKGRHHSIFVDKDFASSREYSVFWTSLQNGFHQVSQFKRYGKDGREIWLQASYSPICTPTGEPFKIVKFSTEITTQKIKDSDRESQIAAIQKSLAVAEFDLDGRILGANENFLAAFAYDLDEVKGRHHSIFVGDAVADSADYRSFWSSLRAGLYQSAQFRRYGKHGKEVWIEATYNPILDPSGVPYKVVKFATDISERKRMEEARQSEVEYAAYHDVLTGLVNRAGMEERFGEMCAQATMETALAVMLVDLDGFKSVNDTFGHAAGDALLVQVASRLSESLRVDDLLVRLGGDEFAVCIKTDDAPDVAVRSAASRIVSELQRPFELGDISVSVGASVGVAVTHGGATVSDVLRDADTALYHVKENGKNAYRIFDTVLLDAVTMRRRIEKELAAAIRNGLLDVAYQPVVELTSGVEIGAEALCRWHHPALGDVPPSTFVPIAEETGLIGELGMLVLDKVLADMKTWPLTHVIAVNLSPKQLEDDHFVEEVAKRFGAAGVEPTRVELEVTETVLLENNPKMLNVLQSLKELGFGTALDDFGTGYSSLSYLKLFPFDRVKIDRSFVAEIASNEISAPIITAVAQLAHALNMRVTAEGVETGEQMEFVRDAGCDAAQGYYFGRPTTK